MNDHITWIESSMRQAVVQMLVVRIENRLSLKNPENNNQNRFMKSRSAFGYFCLWFTKGFFNFW